MKLDFLNPNLKIGIVYSIGIFLLIYGIFFLKKTDFLRSEYTIFAHFNQANSLNIGDPVVLRGLKIGKVIDLQVENNQIKAIFSIPKTLNLPKNSKADIVSQSLLGGKVIEITQGDATTFLTNHDTIETMPITDMTKKLTQSSGELLDKIQPLTDQLEVLLNNVNKSVVSLQESIVLVNRVLAKNEQNVNQIIQQTNELFAHINQKTVPLVDQSLEQIRNFGITLNSPSTKNIFNNVEQTTQHLAELTKNINSSSNTIHSLFSTNELHQKLVDVLTDFKANPERYVKISVFSKDSPEVKYKNKIEAVEMKKKWKDYQQDQKNTPKVE